MTGFRWMALLAALVLAARGGNAQTAPGGARMVDARATAETRALFRNLLRTAERGQVMYGHQDDLAYGVSWTREPGRSDVKEVVGAYPAVYGWELGDLERGDSASLDGVRFDDIRRWIQEGYARGGVVTVSWHMDNPVTLGDSWDTTTAVPAILPGGARHARYREWLDRFAEYARTLRGSRGEPIPVIFRPFHEMSGSWFWWGRGHVTPAQYRELWRFTVRYLRDEKGLHNLIWAYSPNASDDFQARYLEFYPGDEYVDVLGLDEYFWPNPSGDPAATLAEHLRFVVAQAEARGKVAALTETGFEGIPDAGWWTGTLLRAIRAQRIAYVLTWRNANAAAKPGHFYGPYPGHPSAPDFVRFARDLAVLLENELPPMYR